MGEDIIPAVQHDGGSVIVSDYFASLGPGLVAVIDGTMNFVCTRKCVAVKLKCIWVTQHDTLASSVLKRLIRSFYKYLIAVLTAMGGASSY